MNVTHTKNSVELLERKVSYKIVIMMQIYFYTTLYIYKEKSYPKSLEST